MIKKNNNKKNRYISYIKGLAFIAILIIHLCEWGGASSNIIYTYFRKIFYPGLSILIFVSMSGSLIYLAYKDYDLKRASKRLIQRGFKLVGVYYLYSIIKLFIFNFNKEIFYGHFLSSNKLSSLVDILLLKNSDTGIPILFTIGIFLIISPILLYFIRKAKNPNIPVIFAILFFIVLSFIVSPTSSYIYNLLYSNNFAIFPLFLWIIPYLIGALIAINGFEKSKKTIFFTSFIGFTVYSIFFTINNMPINPAIYTYQLSNGSVKFYTYFVLFSFMIISILMYILEYVANMNNATINKILNIIEFIGDQTFDLYLIQWIVIDITYWIFSPKIWIIFITVLSAMFIYFFIKYKKQIKKEAILAE